MSKSVARNAASKTLLNIFDVVLPLMTGPYLARTLAVSCYGEFNKAKSILDWFLPFAAFGIYNYGIREIARRKKDRIQVEELFSSLFAMNALSSVLVFVLYGVYVFTSSLPKPVYMILGLNLLCQMFSVEWMNEAFENYGFIMFKSMAVRILNAVGIVVFVREPDDLIPYALVYTTATLLNYFVGFLYIKKTVRFRNSFSSLPGLFVPLLYMLMLSSSTMLYTSLDRLFLSLFGTPEEVSFYFVPQSIIWAVSKLFYPIVSVTVPRLSKFYGDGAVKDYKDLLKTSSGACLMLCIPACIGVSCMSGPIILLYGGQPYAEAGIVLNLFALRTLLWFGNSILSDQVLFVFGMERALVKMRFICGSINFALNSALLLSGNLSPALLVVTTIVAEAVMFVLQIGMIHKRVDLPINIVFDSGVWKYLLTAIAFYPISAFTGTVLHLGTDTGLGYIVKLGIIVCICIVFYFFVLFVTKDKTFLDLGKKALRIGS